MEEQVIKNPFIVGHYVSDHYFCDREAETDFLIKQVINGRNTSLIAHRRLGKTGLISHLFNQEKIKTEYHTVFVDIYASSSLTEFVYLLGKAIFDQIKKERFGLKEQFFQIIKSLRIGFNMDPATGETGFEIGLGDISVPTATLDEIFEFLESQTKPCIVAIDEFQQIGLYEDKNVEALLRTKIQQCKNTVFIFSGSQRHLMSKMFNSPSKPFYQSAVTMTLEPISLDKYSSFATTLFQKRRKAISPIVIEKVYNKFDGTTWFIQMMMNELFALTGQGECCTEDKIEIAGENIIHVQDGAYKILMSQLSYRQKQVLQAIAKAGKAEKITSAEFVNKHSLSSASTVQSAVRVLLKKDIITQEEDRCWIYDYFFREWLKQNF